MDNKSFARIAVWILVAVVLFTVFRQFETNSAQPLDQTSYTQFMDDAKAGKIRKVEVQGRKILVTPQSGAEYAITSPGDLWMVDDLRKNGVQVNISIMKKNKKFQKEQMTAEGYTEFVEFFNK